MPRLLERSLTGLFRSRWGVALVIAVLVLAIVGVGRIFSDGSTASPLTERVSTGPTATVDPSHDDDGVIVNDEPPPEPTTSPGSAEPEAVAYAFAAAWVDHKNVSAKTWHNGLVPNATEDLADELNGVDPADVPADRVLGRPQLVPIGDGLVNAVVTVDSGKLTLRMVAPQGRWLVDGVDWDGP
ncbi:hypothetical protein GCM10020358_47300 [Amorphoplanes nipponensis]|uniref:Uncharacterized protein n=1 Tax=Actinoplanes nipponensis TaxID=135950 RepID=A0A919MTS7_9ACTN|nr:hypothetical protein [Actinoplanes nipponensis]GIE49430.1 hypothetical protein Ani05nite_29640 [Actinoplanes nipponensis]